MHVSKHGQQGFTVLELAIVLVCLFILLTLAVYFR
jgi:Tfp pilus assembly protein FimT